MSHGGGSEAGGFDVSGRPAPLFRSDWAGGTVQDTWHDLYDANGVLSVQSAAGFGFPASMANVLQIEHRAPTVKSGHVAYGLSNTGVPAAPYAWALPAIGQSLFFRQYLRVAWDAAVSSSQNSCHFIESENTSATWAYTFGKTAGLTSFVCSLNTPALAPYGGTWRLGTRVPQDEQPAGTYRSEWQAQRLGVNLWNVYWRWYGTNDTSLLYTPANIWSTFDPVLMSVAGLGVALQDAEMRGWWLGTNGGTFPVLPSTQYSYYGGVCVRWDDWCGPYTVANG